MTETRPTDEIDAVAQALGLRPCPVLPRSWCACGGDADPTVGHTCSDGQCTNSTHRGRRPCTKAWHRRREVLGPLLAERDAAIARAEEAEAERDDALARIEAVKRLHRTHFENAAGIRYGCEQCHTIDDLCPTARALTAPAAVAALAEPAPSNAGEAS